jgi:hypothetical protein
MQQNSHLHHNILIRRDYDIDCMGYTGIAATLLPTSRTIHTLFDSPFSLTEQIKEKNHQKPFLKALRD